MMTNHPAMPPRIARRGRMRVGLPFCPPGRRGSDRNARSPRPEAPAPELSGSSASGESPTISRLDASGDSAWNGGSSGVRVRTWGTGPNHPAGGRDSATAVLARRLARIEVSPPISRMLELPATGPAGPAVFSRVSRQWARSARPRGADLDPAFTISARGGPWPAVTPRARSMGGEVRR